MIESGYECELKESDSFVSVEALRQYLVDNYISCILGIHAVHAGKLLKGLCILELQGDIEIVMLLLCCYKETF